MTEIGDLRVVLPNGKTVTVKSKAPVQEPVVGSYTVPKPEKFIKEVPLGAMSSRLNKRKHKIKRVRPRGMQGGDFSIKIVYLDEKGIERYIHSQPSPDPKKLLEHPPTTTCRTYDVDTFGHARCKPNIER